MMSRDNAIIIAFCVARSDYHFLFTQLTNFSASTAHTKKQPSIRNDCVSCCFVLAARTASTAEMGLREACLRLSRTTVSRMNSGAQCLSLFCELFHIDHT